MTVHRARVLVLAAVLVGISALVLSARLHAQQPLDELRLLAEQGDAWAQATLGFRYRYGDGVPQGNSSGGEALREE